MICEGDLQESRWVGEAREEGGEMRSRRRVPQPPWLREATEIRGRESLLAELVADRRVLDLGVVDSWRAKEPVQETLSRFATSLHEQIRRHGREVLGVDIDAEGVAILQARGYEVVCADVETLALGRQFDTVVAGEIIEHLPNPARALEAIRKHLHPAGQLVLSTCNPFYFNQFLKILKYGDIQVHEEHTMWFDPRTLAHLLELTGYEVQRLCWICTRRRHGHWKHWPARLWKYFCPSFLIVAGLAEAPAERGGETTRAVYRRTG